MNVVLYANGLDAAAGQRLKNIIKSKVLHQSLEIFGNIDSFAKRIRQFPRSIDVVVLFAQSNEQLLDLISLKDYLEDVRIILILPDRESETISVGHKLFPKYLSYADGDLTDVAAVLEKILKRMNDNNIYPKRGEKKWQN
jgi:predicted nucleotidyltransferase